MKRRQDEEEHPEVKVPPTISQVITRVLGQARLGRAANPGVATEDELIELNDVEGFKSLMERNIALTEEDVTVPNTKHFPPWLTELIRRIKAIPPTERVNYNLLREAIGPLSPE